MSDCDKIIQGLESGDCEAQREAAFLAADTECAEAVPALSRLLGHANLGVQEAADQALRKIGGSASVRAVAPLLRSEEAPERNLAMDILREIGNQDFSTLVELLHDEDPDIRIFISDIMGSTDVDMAVAPLCEALLKDPEVNVRYQSAVSLGSLGRKSAAKCLNKALKDDEWVQFAVIEALSKIRDESSLGALVGALDRTSDLVASMIVEALGEMGNVKAVGMLLKQMDKSPTALRNTMAKSVVKILGGKSLTLLSEVQREKLRQYLLVALKDTDSDIQDAAVTGLGFVGGEHASRAVLALAGSMDQERDADRLEMCMKTLANIGLTPALEEALGGDRFLAVRAALETYARIGDQAAAPLLKDIFWKVDRDLQRDVIGALNRIAPGGAEDFYMDILGRHTDGTVIKGALKFLAKNSNDPTVGDVLFSFLHHKYDDVKEVALDACVVLGGQEMMARFRDLFTSSEPLDRLMAVYAMGKLGAGDFLDELGQALEDELPDIRKVALEAFSHLEFKYFSPWLPTVVARLSDENKEVRLTLVDILGGFPDEEINPYLLQALGDGDDWVRVRAIEALGTRRAEEAVPELVRSLSADNKMVAIRAAQALGAVGGPTAFRALLDVMDGGDADLQAAAEEALAELQTQDGGEE